MEPDPTLNGEFMGESSPHFEWEVDSMQKHQAWDAWGSGAETASKSSAQVVEKARGRERASLETVTV